MNATTSFISSNSTHSHHSKVRHSDKKTEFKEFEPVKLVNRDYGLIRVNATSSTPHPKKYTGVDMYTLSTRLYEQQSDILKEQQSLGNMSLGTPHPSKALAINPHILKTRMDEIVLGTPSIDERSIQSSNLRRNIRANKSTDVGKKKKVTLVAPLTLCRTSEAISKFQKRRQMFYEGEFTIARYGKKMSEHVMPKLSKKISIDRNIIIKDLEATNEIDMYIQGQGYRTESTIQEMNFLNVNKATLHTVRQDISNIAKLRTSALNIAHLTDYK